VSKRTVSAEFSAEDVKEAVASHFAGTELPPGATTSLVRVLYPTSAPQPVAYAEWVTPNMALEGADTLKRLVQRRLLAVFELAAQHKLKLVAHWKTADGATHSIDLTPEDVLVVER